MFIVLAVYSGHGDGDLFLSIFPLLSFILGLPAFLVLAVPALHLLPWLKHARPRTAALVGRQCSDRRLLPVSAWLSA
ncbi:hypothetical protein VC273_01175 [Xanthomonas nasturtii]|uniref:hypothetical protein n=1 Tax=Xanthomonas TaxID=338 RepID=UPI002B228947|nr:hypothetical protein [Xanthomonas nasturtii]MEA9554584.1 hypothetical protein [Xanthomonas nasturtii]